MRLGGFGKLLFVVAGLVLLAVEVEGLSVCPQSVTKMCGGPCEIDVPILIWGTEHLQALGFDLQFAKSEFNYVGWRPGNVIRGWQFRDARVDAESLRVRVGAFDTVGFTLSGTDTLAIVTFMTSCRSGIGTLRADHFVDALRDAAPCSSTTTCSTATEAKPWTLLKSMYR